MSDLEKFAIISERTKALASPDEIKPAREEAEKLRAAMKHRTIKAKLDPNAVFASWNRKGA